MTDSNKYAKELEFALRTAEEAAKIIIDGFKSFEQDSENSFTLKGNCPVDLVTKVDPKVEKYIISEINKHFPGDSIEAEETASFSSPNEFHTGRLWSIDPIDGTTNFIHGFPTVSCSIGLFDNRVPVVGVVHNPFLSLRYYASLGSGSFMESLHDHQIEKLPLKYLNTNKKPLDLQQSLVALGIGGPRTSDDTTKFDKYMNLFTRLIHKDKDSIHGVRLLGGTALELCHLAAGQLDALWVCGVSLHDLAAGACILQEAGGVLYPAFPKSEDSAEPLKDMQYVFGEFIAVRNGPKDTQIAMFKRLVT